MAELKHIGRHTRSSRKCAVAYRVIPGDSSSCLVVYSDTLEAADHESLMKLVESNTGQNAYEFAEAMHRTPLSDGRNMLVHFSKTGKLVKVPTAEIELTPNTQSKVNLAELNQIVASQKGITIDDLALKPSTKNELRVETAASVDTIPAVKESAIASVNEVLTDEALAAQYRSQADSLYKEAKRLRDQAEELVPTKKKVT